MSKKGKVRVSSLVLKSGGFKGAQIKYNVEEMVNDFIHPNDVVKRNNAPVPKELQNKVKGLKKHLFILAGYAETLSPDAYISDELIQTRTKISITGISMSGGGFVIEGTILMLDTRKTIKVKTPVIDNEDEYNYFTELSTLVEEIMELSADYAENNIAMNPRQYIFDFHTEEEGMDEKEANQVLEAMSEEDINERVRKLMEKNGVIVIPDPDSINGNENNDDDKSDQSDNMPPVASSEVDTSESFIPEENPQKKGKVVDIKKNNKVEIPASEGETVGATNF